MNRDNLQHIDKHADGFTLIELLLAMTGIAFLLLFVVFGIVHVTGLYTKGVAIRDINQVGRQLTEDVSRDLRYGGAVRTGGTNRICVGNKSYIWNSSRIQSDVNVYDDPVNGNPPVTFAVAQDTSYCDNPSKKVSKNTESVLGPLVMLQEFEVKQPNLSIPVYDIKMVFSTAGSNAPTVRIVSDASRYECSPIFGQFCAFGEFKTSVYARRTN